MTGCGCSRHIFHIPSNFVSDQDKITVSSALNWVKYYYNTSFQKRLSLLNQIPDFYCNFHDIYNGIWKKRRPALQSAGGACKKARQTEHSRLPRLALVLNVV